MSNIVSNICVYAAEDRANPIAIIVPERSKFMKLAEENGIKEDNFENLVHNDKIRDVVLKELQGTGRKAKLAGFEIVEGIILTERDWTVENVRFYSNSDFRDSFTNTYDRACSHQHKRFVGGKLWSFIRRILIMRMERPTPVANVNYF